MNTRALIRHPLLAASLGAAVVALPASALYLYGSGHPAKAASTPAIVASAPAPIDGRSSPACLISGNSCRPTVRPL